MKLPFITTPSLRRKQDLCQQISEVFRQKSLEVLKSMVEGESYVSRDAAREWDYRTKGYHKQEKRCAGLANSPWLYLRSESKLEQTLYDTP